jgi:hypothetical protein
MLTLTLYEQSRSHKFDEFLPGDVMRLFRRRLFADIFPALAAGVVLCAIAVEPQIADATNPGRAFLNGIVGGAFGILMLFLFLKALELRALSWKPAANRLAAVGPTIDDLLALLRNLRRG